MKFNNIVSKMVWNDRYRKNGESLEENLRRVAKTFAHDKDQEEEFFRVMDNGYFFPAGRSMSNAGIGEMLTYNNCFLAGTKVLTKNGYVNIEDVKVGSLVATEDGSWQPVNEVMVRDYEGDIYHLSGSKLLGDIYCTPNHQFMTNHGWVAAEKLSKNNDMLKTSNMEYVKIGNIEAEAGQKCSVYNISVENIHSYVVNGVVVHNCYVCPIVPDDMNGIFEAVKLGAITHKSGGGIGYDFSYLRPNGSPTSNDAVASGPVSFMHVFNTQTATIQAGSRRGANMGVLNVYHPDIEEFISAKSYEAGILNHFNLSVMIDDDFMGAVNDDREIYLHWPVYDDCGRIIKDEKKWKIKKKVRARDIWDKIMRKAYESGEPGVLFYDNMNKDNTTNYKENIISTNPCFSGRMKLLTTEGYKTFKELSDRKSVNIINGKGNVSKDNKVWCSGTKKVVRVMFTNGNNVECTPDHKFLLANGIEWCEAQNLQNKAVKTYPGRGAICCAVVDIGEMEVYDFSEKDEHSGVVEGYVVHNCGEYVAGMVYGADNTGKQIKSADFGGACNLGSLFIHNFVRAPFTNDAFFDYEALKSSVRTAVHFLDNVIDVNRFPNPVYENYQKNFRTIGLGITGLADACAMLGMSYDSDRAIEFSDYLMEQIAATAYKTSIEMAKENGPFPFFEKEGYINSGFIQKHLRSNPQLWGDIVNDIEKYGIRNARMISVAPVGTLSLTYGNNCSSGVEPIFQTSYKRRVHVGGQEEKDVQTVDLKDYAYSIWENTKDKIDMPEDILFKTALNISVDSHIKMLRAVSYHVDASVSKCVAKGTKIQTNHGIMNIEDMGYAVGADSFGKPLDDLFVKDMNGDWKKVTSHYSGGIKPTRKIKFANGFTLECSFVHKLMNKNGEWVQAVDLKPGDKVMYRVEKYSNECANDGIDFCYETKKQAKDVRIPNRMNEELAMLLGMLAADGYVCRQNGSVGLTTNSDEIEDVFTQLVYDVFNRTCSVKYDKRTKDTRSIYFNSKIAAEFIISLIGDSCENKHIPNVIMLGTVSCMKAFLSGVTLDGYVNGQSKKLSIYEGYSKMMRDQIASICSYIGAEYYIHTKYVKNGRKSKYSYGVKIYCGDIKPIETKKQEYTQREHKRIPIPKNFEDYKPSTSHPNYSSYRMIHQGLLDSIRVDVANGLGIKDDGRYLIEIKEIENSCNEVYDIEVEDTHSYLIDGVISHNTINVPAEYTFEQTKEIYDNVWRSGIKGCTIFRPSEIRPGVLVSSDSKPEEKKEEHKWGDVLSCSDDLIMKKRRIMGGCGSIHVIAGFDPVTGEVRETYFSKGSTGGCSNFMTGLSRAISMLGRAGVSIEKIKDQLDSTGACPSYATRRATKKDTSAGSCCPMAIGNALMEMYKEVQDELSVVPHDKKKDNCEECIDPQAPIELHPAIPAKRCPECGELLDMEGGCIICRSCGYTKCE